MIATDHTKTAKAARKSSSKFSFTTILSLIWRLLLASLGGYLCTIAVISLCARLGQLWLGWTFSNSLMGAILLSFLLYSLLIIAVIASRKLLSTSIWLVLLTATCFVLNYWLQGGNA
ncbi:hypothetical protein [Alkalimonas mucilaginosa]|uniref:Iron uptake protein n=1 Tax=Alkalimonas mucilaginosa TaxID=3057676 RepID=A0ABU7JID2_9GAMM|nr:hypothetical protein [Alkalimonas sp. MEB004]MEE2024850.1 hypothetical protein [Alkalimonas sp. MEB004]